MAEPGGQRLVAGALAAPAPRSRFRSAGSARPTSPGRRSTSTQSSPPLGPRCAERPGRPSACLRRETQLVPHTCQATQPRMPTPPSTSRTPSTRQPARPGVARTPRRGARRLRRASGCRPCARCGSLPLPWAACEPSDSTASRRRSSQRCPRWRCGPGRSTWARASPTPTARPRWSRARCERSESGANQYAPGIGVPELRQAIARHQQRHYGLDLDPDPQVVVTTGCTEAIAGALLGLVDPGRRGRRARALLRLLRRDARRWPAAYDDRSPCAPPTSGSTLDELRDAITPRTRFLLVNTPAQPDRRGARRRGAQGDRRGRARARPRRDHRRGLRAPHLRRRRAPAAGHPARDVRAHADPVERGQVLLLHRLEGRLGHRPRRAGRRRARREAVAQLHLGGTAAAGGGVRRSTTSRTSRRAGRRPPAPPRPAARRTRRGRDPRHRRARGHLLRDHRHRPSRVAGRPWRSAARCPSGPAWWRSPPRSFYDDPDAGRHLVRWAFCKDESVLDDAVHRLAAADLRA